MDEETLVLYRPVGPRELARIRELDWRAFPPRLHYQPIFYPVLNEEYARKIARDWNATRLDTGYQGFVVRFQVRRAYVERYPVQVVGARWHQELWVPPMSSTSSTRTSSARSSSSQPTVEPTDRRRSRSASTTQDSTRSEQTCGVAAVNRSLESSSSSLERR